MHEYIVADAKLYKVRTADAIEKDVRTADAVCRYRID